MAEMMTLKNGRYIQRQPCKSATNGEVAKFYDTVEKREVFIKEYRDLRYPASTTDTSGKPLPSLVEASHRVDEYIRKTEEINGVIRNVAHHGGDVVVTLDFFREGIRIYKVSELIPLKDWPGSDVRKHLTEDQIDLMMLREMRALQALHQAGVLHCDLKPDNIFIVEQDGAYVGMISDFDDSILMNGHIDMKNIVCTQEYMSPEICAAKLLGEDVPEELSAKHMSTPSDIFTMGLIYHEYLTGSLPAFNDEEYEQYSPALLAGEPLNLSESLSPAHRMLIGQMLAILPAMRMQTCSDVARAIQQIRQHKKDEYVLTVMDGRSPAANRKMSLIARFGSNPEMELDVDVAAFRTDRSGRAMLKGLTDAKYFLVVDDETLVPVQWKEEGGKLVCTVQIGKVETYALTMMLNDRLLAGKAVRLTQYNNHKVAGQVFSATTNASGVAEFENLPQGMYVAECEGIRARVTWDRNRRFVCKNYTYTLRFEKKNTPVAGLSVVLCMATEKGVHELNAETDKNGEITLPNVKLNAKWSVKVGGKAFDIKWGSDRRMCIVLSSSGRLRVGVLMEGKNTPVQGVRVYLGKAVDKRFVRVFETLTDSKGIADMGEYDEGRYYVKVMNLPAGLKLKDRELGKAVPVMVKEGMRPVAFRVMQDTQNVIGDEDIPESVSDQFSHIIKYRDGRVELTRRADGKKVGTRANQLAMWGLDRYQ